MQRSRPAPTPDTVPFWEATKSSRFVFQQCRACDTRHFPPRQICVACGVDALEWHTATGSGEIETFSVVHRAPSPEFKARVPYVIALVRLTEGVRIMTNILGPNATEAGIGDRVKLVFEPTSDGYTLPQAELVR